MKSIKINFVLFLIVPLPLKENEIYQDRFCSLFKLSPSPLCGGMRQAHSFVWQIESYRMPYALQCAVDQGLFHKTIFAKEIEWYICLSSLKYG